MKVTVNDVKNDEWKYPALVQSKSDSQVIVLALSSSSCGMFTGVALDAKKHYEIGELRTDWYITQFNPYNGSIILQN